MALNTVQALLVAYVTRLQELEDAAFTVLDPLSDASLESITGDLLDKVGARCGEERGGRIDADYRAAIRIRVRVNRSRGKAEDVVAVALLASTHSIPVYTEFTDVPATFQIDITNLAGPIAVAALLKKTRMGGTSGVLVYSVDALDAFEWGDSTDGTNTNTAEQWADSVGSTGPAWPSGVAI